MGEMIKVVDNRGWKEDSREWILAVGYDEVAHKNLIKFNPKLQEDAELVEGIEYCIQALNEALEQQGKWGEVDE